MAGARKMYLNPKQKAFLAGRQPIKLFLGGRGSGKTHALGVNQRLKAGKMPRSKGFLAAMTYNQILTKTLPAMINGWALFGLVEGIDYVIGIKPPKHFSRPISPPKKFQNVISFSNGRCVEMVSLDRPDLARGGSYDDGDIDEAALLKQEHWTKILLPSVRGNRHIFSTYLHQQVGLYTSIPWKPSGYWILDFEEKMEAYPSEYLVIEANAYDNIHILGERGIERLKREMPHGEFLIEVMNERVIRVEDPFYSSLNLERHSYAPKYTYTEDSEGRIITDKSNDYDPKRLIDTSWDFGGWFNCCTAWQEKAHVERMINSFHANVDKKLSDVVTAFCNTYTDHENKLVRIWGEPRGHDRLPNTPSIYSQLTTLFSRRGWHVEVMVEPGYASRMHIERREFINTMLDETDTRLPKIRINQEKCKSPLIAMQGAQSTPEGKKDKGKEKVRDFPQEHATHYTDNFDYYLTQKHGWRLMEDVNHSSPGEALVI